MAGTQKPRQAPGEAGPCLQLQCPAWQGRPLGCLALPLSGRGLSSGEDPGLLRACRVTLFSVQAEGTFCSQLTWWWGAVESGIAVDLYVRGNRC